MLKNIPTILSPTLLTILMAMGHGHEIVVADSNFPSASMAQRLIRADGHGVPAILQALLELFPLDAYVEWPVALMQVAPGDDVKPAIWDEYRRIINESGEKFDDFEMIERFAFYERARKAYAVIATGEKALYANIILKKGVI